MTPLSENRIKDFVNALDAEEKEVMIKEIIEKKQTEEGNAIEQIKIWAAATLRFLIPCFGKEESHRILVSAIAKAMTEE